MANGGLWLTYLFCFACDSGLSGEVWHDKIALVAARDAVVKEMKKLPVASSFATWYINKRRFGGTD